jgi:hypothetical protein
MSHVMRVVVMVMSMNQFEKADPEKEKALH